MRDDDERRLFVDRREELCLVDGHAVFGVHGDNLCAAGALLVEQVEDRGKVHVVGNDLATAARFAKIETGEELRVRGRDVGLHDDRAAGGIHQSACLIADLAGQVPPMFLPRAHAPRRPHVGVRVQRVVGTLRHRAEGIGDEIRGCIENGELIAIAVKLVHPSASAPLYTESAARVKRGEGDWWLPTSVIANEASDELSPRYFSKRT